MPNLVNEILLRDLQKDFADMGSCLVVSFDAVGPKLDSQIRDAMRDAGVKYRVVRNRLAAKAFAALNLELQPALKGKCALAIAEKEKAIGAAKALRELAKKNKDVPLTVVGGVVEGQAYLGKDAAVIADLPDRDTVNAMIAQAVSGPARKMAMCLNAVAGGMARCIQAKIDKG
jgi:large subunit ribosomal protein L10